MLLTPLHIGRTEVEPWLIAVLCAVNLAMIGYAKWSNARFRKRAVRVSGTIVRRFRRSRYTSYYVRYAFEGRERVAEYCGSSIRHFLDEGATLEVMIDPAAPPDGQVPTGRIAWSGSGGGSCMLPGSPLWSTWDVLYTLALVITLGWSLRAWLRPLLAGV